MEPPKTKQDDARQHAATVDRLNNELEQSRVALEDAHADIAVLTRERDAALAGLSRQRTLIASSERKADELRRELASMLSAPAEEAERSNPSPDTELRMLLEESTVLAEELQASNEALLQTNRDLSLRVAERTDQRDRAMEQLKHMNAGLSHRIEEETAARVAAQAELFQMQKLESIGQLTGGIAHDFNNLLTVIISGMQVIGQIRDEQRRDRLLRRVEEAAWRGADLTRRLLAFARRQPLQPERVDLAVHFDGLRELLAHSLRGDITVETSAASGLWPVETDVGALELALLNLAMNARDAMPAGGRLVVSAQNHTIVPHSARDVAVELGDYVQITVRDTGTGMPPEVLGRAFEPFFTTKGSGQGTGLGLAQVYGFARQSGGTSWVQSRLGEGTQVHLLLPRSLRTAATPLPPRVPEETVRRRQQLSILVVEDDDAVAAATLDMLAELGHSAVRAASVATALAALSSEDTVDLVFSDVLLPGGGSGLDLAREMRRHYQGLPIILTSGYGGTVTDKLASANLPFLRKPYQIEALRLAIAGAVHAPGA